MNVSSCFQTKLDILESKNIVYLAMKSHPICNTIQVMLDVSHSQFLCFLSVKMLASINVVFLLLFFHINSCLFSECQHNMVAAKFTNQLVKMVETLIYYLLKLVETFSFMLMHGMLMQCNCKYKEFTNKQGKAKMCKLYLVQRWQT